MWMILLGRQASTPFSHGLSQPIDQCKSKPVTSGHDILWLNFKCVYRSESLCTCRQKHWGCRLTHNARRFQLHLSICQGPPSFALYENNEHRKSTRGRLRSGRHRSGRLQPRAAFPTQPTASSNIQSYYEAVNLPILRCNLYLTGTGAFSRSHGWLQGSHRSLKCFLNWRKNIKITLNCWWVSHSCSTCLTKVTWGKESLKRKKAGCVLFYVQIKREWFSPSK